jgi:hypothetical protein
VSEQLSRRQVALILQRTAELERQRTPASEAITGDDLRKIADELGLSSEALSQALAENKAGLLDPGEPASLLDRVYGKASVVVRRFVPGTAASVQATLDRYFREQTFDIKRRGPDWIIWERQTGMMSAFKRMGAGPYRLPGGLEYHVRVAELPGGPHPVLVQIEVDVGRLRDARVRNAVTAAALGTAGAVAGVILLPSPVELLAVAGGLGMGVGGPWRGRTFFRDSRASLEAGLDRLLDFLEHEPTRVNPAKPRDPISRFVDFLGLGD